MTQLRRTATTLAALVTAGFALTGPVGGAQAADTHWKTLATIVGGKIQACKVPETSTGPWQIKLRVDATHASGRVSGVAFITKNGEATDKSWKSGWVDAGRDLVPGQGQAACRREVRAGRRHRHGRHGRRRELRLERPAPLLGRPTSGQPCSGGQGR